MPTSSSNTESGFTGQYAGLQKLYEQHKDSGFVILAFPANNFMGQEPGTDPEIKKFCTLTYGVTFPMFAKISVKGDDKHPLYKFLTGKATNPGFDGEISWNFNMWVGCVGGVWVNVWVFNRPISRYSTLFTDGGRKRPTCSKPYKKKGRNVCSDP